MGWEENFVEIKEILNCELEEKLFFHAGFPLGEFFRAHKQKANVIGW